MLRGQLTEIRRSEDRLLTTVFWALGTCAGIVFLLVGFSWFLNFRVYERDKQALKQDLMTDLRRATDEAKLALTKDFSKALDNKFDSLKESLEERISLLHRSIQLTQCRHLEQIYFTDCAEHDYPEALDTLALLIETAIEADASGLLSSYLDYVHNHLNEGVRPNAELTALLIKAIEGLPPAYETERVALTDRLRQLRSASGTTA
jgi:hypothetical protein